MDVYAGIQINFVNKKHKLPPKDYDVIHEDDE